MPGFGAFVVVPTGNPFPYGNNPSRIPVPLLGVHAEGTVSNREKNEERKRKLII